MFKKRVFILLKIFIYFLVDNILNFIFLFIKSKDNNEILIFSPSTLGDFVIFTNSLKEYKTFYKNHKIVLFCDKNLSILAKKLNYIDKILSTNYEDLFFGKNIFSFKFNLKTLFYRLKILFSLKKSKYTKIINHINLFYISIFIKSLNSYEKIGIYDENKFFKNAFSNMYTKTIKIDKNLSELDIFATFFRQLTNKKDFLSGLPYFNFYMENNFQNLSNYICLTLGGSFLEKCYSVENFAKIISNLKPDINICLLGIKSESFLGEKFIKIYKGKNKIINFIGKTDLLELIKLIKFSKFVIGSDTGAIHLALANKVPSICILSGHSYGFCQPYKPKISLTEFDKKILPICIYKKMDCFGCGTEKSCKYKLSKNKKFKCIEEIEPLECLKQIKSSHLKQFFNIE